MRLADDGMKDAARGDWFLCQVFERVVSPGKVGDKHSSSHSQSPEYSVSRNSGYITFKDRSTVNLYSYDLFSTPRLTVEGPNEYTIGSVHGLTTLNCWTGGEPMHRLRL